MKYTDICVYISACGTRVSLMLPFARICISIATAAEFVKALVFIDFGKAVRKVVDSTSTAGRLPAEPFSSNVFVHGSL